MKERSNINQPVSDDQPLFTFLNRLAVRVQNCIEIYTKLNLMETSSQKQEFASLLKEDFPLIINGVKFDEARNILNRILETECSDEDLKMLFSAYINEYSSIISSSNILNKLGFTEYKMLSLFLNVAFASYVKKSCETKSDYSPISNINCKKQGIYRGHSNQKYSLIPTMFRNQQNCEESQFSECHVDMKWITDQYKELDLFRKYWNWKSEEKKISENIEYSMPFYEMMQHALSYSPFLDFTRSPKIALSFALANKNSIGEYSNIPCEVIQIKRLGNKIPAVGSKSGKMQEWFSATKVTICKHLNPFVHSFSYDFKGKGIFLKTIKDALTPQLLRIEKMSNDRMKTQKGVLVYLQQGIIINGKISWNLIDGVRLHHYRFSLEDSDESKKIFEAKTRIKETILNDKAEDKTYSQECLLNPYQYFVESYFEILDKKKGKEKD